MIQRRLRKDSFATTAVADCFCPGGGFSIGEIHGLGGGGGWGVGGVPHRLTTVFVVNLCSERVQNQGSRIKDWIFVLAILGLRFLIPLEPKLERFSLEPLSSQKT